MLADGGVGAREGVFLGTEGAGPEEGAVVNTGVGIEGAMAAGAEEGVVGEEGGVSDGGKGCAHHGEGDDEGGGGGAGGRPGVPRPPEALDRLQLGKIHGGFGDRGMGETCIGVFLSGRHRLES